MLHEYLKSPLGSYPSFKFHLVVSMYVCMYVCARIYDCHLTRVYIAESGLAA